MCHFDSYAIRVMMCAYTYIYDLHIYILYSPKIV